MKFYWLILLMLKNINTLEIRDDRAKVVFLEPSIDECSLPTTLSVSVNTTTLSLNLRLERNNEIQGNTPVYVTRRNDHGEMEIVRGIVIDSEIRGEYLDVQNRASVEISCFVDTDNHSNFQMKGFVSSPDGTLYTVEPNSSWKRDTASQSTDYNYRIVLETPSLNAENYDDDGIVSPSKETQIGKSSRRIGDQRKKRETQPVYIDIVTLIDYSVFLRWFSRSTQDTDLLKRTEAIQNIRRHFSHIVNAIQLRFKTISSQYNIRLVGYVIEDEHHGDWFENVTTQRDHENKTVNGYRLLPSARDYVNNVKGFPENDHVMAFTAYDLYSIRDADQSNGLLGRAYVGTVCRIPNDSISIVEYRDRLVDDMLVASHELGHALNASHDGVGNLCSGADMFIMSSNYSSVHSLNHSNSYLFSNCSSSYITRYVEDLLSTGSTSSQSCLLNSLGAASVSNISGEMPGQLYDPDTQCRMVYGEESYLCRNVVNSSSICKRMYCRKNEGSLCSSINAAQGTTCGNKKWCIAGECMYSDSAPRGNSKCLFGNMPGIVYENWTCEEFIPPDEKAQCYLKVNVETCCGTCLKYKTNVTGCEYGDRNSTACEGFITSEKKHLCYGNGNAEFCCGTCQKYETNDQGCEYGDKNPTACEGGITSGNKYLCYHKENSELCCGTCQKYETNEPGCEYGDNLWNTSCHVDKCLDSSETNYIDICCDTCRNFRSPSSTVAPTTSTQPIFSSTAAMSITPSSNFATNLSVIHTPGSSSLNSIDFSASFTSILSLISPLGLTTSFSSSVKQTSSSTTIVPDISSVDLSSGYFGDLSSFSIPHEYSSATYMSYRSLVDPTTSYFTNRVVSSQLLPSSSTERLVYGSSNIALSALGSSTSIQSKSFSLDTPTSYFTNLASSSVSPSTSSTTSKTVSSSIDPSTSYFANFLSSSIPQDASSTISLSDRILTDPSTSSFTDPISSSILQGLSSTINPPVTAPVDPSPSDFTNLLSSLTPQDASSTASLPDSSYVVPSTSFSTNLLSSSMPQDASSTSSLSDRMLIDPSTSYPTDPISSSILQEISSDTSLSHRSSVDPSISNLSYIFSSSSSINQSNRLATITSYASYTSVSTTSPAGTAYSVTATYQESSPSQAVTTTTPVITTNTGGTARSQPLRILVGVIASVCGIAVLLG